MNFSTQDKIGIYDKSSRWLPHRFARKKTVDNVIKLAKYPLKDVRGEVCFLLNCMTYKILQNSHPQI